MNLRTLLLVATALWLPSSAFAYVDPGSGMLLWQGLVAAMGLVLMFLRNPWQMIKKLIERLRKK